MEDALRGIKILEVGTMTPGKFTGFLLAGWGAESLRIERPSGRQEPVIGDEDLTLNRGKRSIALNLREPRGRDILLRLASRSRISRPLGSRRLRAIERFPRLRVRSSSPMTGSCRPLGRSIRSDSAPHPASRKPVNLPGVMVPTSSIFMPLRASSIMRVYSL